MLVGKFPHVAVGKASNNIPRFIKVIGFSMEHNIQYNGDCRSGQRKVRHIGFMLENVH